MDWVGQVGGLTLEVGWLLVVLRLMIGGRGGGRWADARGWLGLC